MREIPPSCLRPLPRPCSDLSFPPDFSRVFPLTPPPPDSSCKKSAAGPSRRIFKKSCKSLGGLFFLVDYRLSPEIRRESTGTVRDNRQTRKEAYHGTFSQPNGPCTGSCRLFCGNGLSELPVRQDRRPPVRGGHHRQRAGQTVALAGTSPGKTASHWRVQRERAFWGSPPFLILLVTSPSFRFFVHLSGIPLSSAHASTTCQT